MIGMVLGKSADQKPVGAQHHLDKAYFERMKVVDFAVTRDDGLNIDGYRSRRYFIGWYFTNVKNTNIYVFSQFECYFVANYALVPHVPFPEQAVLSQDVFMLV